ncbi:hypothetical protein BU25DRAFT_15259 [Macroventuria anomochaeta]|uniref:Uncharacterized protein n=1 Tax=Macroventuria anomochaeta TaxID=301207 RepID=A0ACB6SKF0_9PLEO|nr:uncharacterized protein BU25DRAFT_15259 [Macroventuria anomochaeta]KAF2633922.1 hypothetical protein BU25DRAFT_15259 [Macroventuria anomochaeta]
MLFQGELGELKRWLSDRRRVLSSRGAPARAYPHYGMTPPKRRLATTRSSAGKDPRPHTPQLPTFLNGFVFVCSTPARKDNLTARLEAV